MNYLSILHGILLLLAVLLGYYLGNKEKAKEQAAKIKEYVKELTEDKEIKVFNKKEPKSENREVLEELEKKQAQN